MLLHLVYGLLFFGNAVGESLEARALARAEAYFATKMAQDGENVQTEGVVRISPHAVHVTFKRHYQGMPVWDRVPRAVHFNHSLKVLSSSQAMPLLTTPAFGNLSEDLRAALISAESGKDEVAYKLKKQSRHIIVDQVAVYPALRLELHGLKHHQRLHLDVDSRSGIVLNRYNPIYSGRTEGRGRIWRHNPIAASQDASDPDTRLVEVPLHGLDGSGYLRGDYVDVTIRYSFIDPDTTSRWTLTYAPGAALEPDFVYLYDPDDARFEEVSAYYWIDRAQRYLRVRGHQLVDWPMEVNVHKFAGTNASYSSRTKRIAFGDGIIDTAEDGDVVRHEYGHAVLDDAVGDRFYDYYGAMFHEGFADFFSYLVGQDAEAEVGPDRYPDFVGEWIGSFQQTTDPPHIRTLLAPSFKFPHLTIEPHRDGKLWSSAFYELAAELGQERSAEIVLESLYFAESANPRHVSAALLMADDLINGGENASCLKSILRERGLFETEQNTEFLSLSLDQPIMLTKEEFVTFICFQAPDVADLRISFTPSGSTYYAFLQKGRVATQADFQKARISQNPSVWDLSTSELSYPVLEPGAYYYLNIINWSPSLQISLETTSPAPPPPELALGSTQTVRFDGRQSYRLSGLNEHKKLAIHFEKEANGDDVILLSATRPYNLGDRWPEFVWSLYLDPSSSPVYVDLEYYFPNVDELFLTCDTRYGTEGSGTLRFEPHQDVDYPELTLDQPLEVILDEAGANMYQLNLEQTRGSLIFRTDELHPFTVKYPGSRYPVDSAIEQGVHTLVLDPNQKTFRGQSGRWYARHPRPNIAGAYPVELMGAAGSLACLSVHEGFPEPPTLLGTDQFLQLELASREMLRYRFTLPESAQDIRLALQDPIPDTLIEFAVYDRQLERLPSSDSWDEVLSTEFPNYRIYDGLEYERSSYFPYFTPGRTYDLLLHNPHEHAQTIDFKFDISTEPEPVEMLTDGMVISFPSHGMDYLFRYHWYEAYCKVFRVEAPQGTQRVQIEFEHLAGPKKVGFSVRDAALKAHPFIAYDLHLDHNDLRHEVDQPFLIYGLYNVPEGDIDPSFRIKLTYHSDSPQNAILDPQHDRLVSGLASSRDFPSELRIPPATERVDLAWFAPEYALDVPVLFQADLGTEIPHDLAPLHAVLWEGTQRRDFHLQGKTTFESMDEEHWIVNQFMAPAFIHHAGWLDDQPFPFELGVRYRPIAAQGTLLIPHDIDGEVVSTASLRLVNPGNEAVQLSLEPGSVVSTLVPGAFLNLSPQPGQQLNIEANGALLSIIGLQGEGWMTTTSGPLQRQDRLLLPHISPNASDWASYLLVSSNGTTPLELSAPSGSMPQPSQGVPELLGNPNPIASWSTLETGMDERGLFREVALNAVQFWRNGSQVAADQPLAQGSRTLYVPHLPDHPDWWSGLTLSNLGSSRADVTVRAYGPSGPSIRSHQFRLAVGETRVDLMGSYLTDGLVTTALSWLRLDASQPLLALEFMGGIHSGDTAGFSLPQRGGTDLVLPGNLHDGAWGVAVVNSVAQAGTARLVAVGLDGQALASQTLTMAAFERRLFSGADFAVAEPYILRLTTTDLRLIAFQLDLDGSDRRAASAAVLIH